MNLSTKLSKKLFTKRPKALSAKLSALLVTGLLTAGTSSVHAATATTTISIDLPEVIVLYTFDAINLAIDPTAVSSLLTGTTTCTDANNLCVRTAGPLDLTGDLISPTDATVDTGLTDDGSTTPAIQAVTIENAFGVRSLGVTTYTTEISELLGSDTINAFSAEDITLGSSLTPGLTLDTGDIDFILDLGQTTGNSASVTYTITVTGV